MGTEEAESNKSSVGMQSMCLKRDRAALRQHANAPLATLCAVDRGKL